MPRPPRSPLFWFFCLFLWFGVLWYLSSQPGKDVALPPIPLSDKLAHFGYFFGGGGIFSAFLFRLDSKRPRWIPLFIAVTVFFAIVGWIDEMHQTHVPGRSGNDPWDWVADMLGALTGAWVFRRFHRLLL